MKYNCFATGRLPELSAKAYNALSTVINIDPDEYFVANNVRFFNTEYKTDFMFVIDFDDELPMFAKTTKILISRRIDDVILCCDLCDE